MATCKQTGLLKYGNMREAVLDAVFNANNEIVRCSHCKCLHVQRRTTPLPPRKPPEPTKGVSGYVHVEIVRIIEETDKAFKVVIQGDREDYRWIPKSAIADHTDYKKGTHNATMSIKEWFAEKEHIQ